MRVAVTTTSESFPAAAEPFYALSLNPIETPCIAIRPEASDVLAAVRELAEHIGAVMISSARTVNIVWGRSVPNLSFVTVGPASTQAVVAAGGRVVLEGGGGLADLIDQLDSFGSASIVFPHGSGTDADLATALPVEILSRQVYRTESIDPPHHPVDAVAFASPSAVDGWFRTRDVNGLVVAAIGGTTASRLEELGAAVDVAPDHPGFGEMARGLAVYGGVRK